MPYDLEAIIQHVRSQNRPGTHQAVLVARIDELEAEVASLRLVTLAAAHLVDSEGDEAAWRWLNCLVKGIPMEAEETTGV